MKLLRRLFAHCFTPAPAPRPHPPDCLAHRQQALLEEARERVRRTPL